ncbi:MAG: SxtJ family membrane protein [bacterium]
MLEEIRNIRTGKSDLRKFGITFAIITGLIGALFIWRARQGYPLLLTLSALFLLMGLVLPVVLKPIYKAWMTLAILMGWVMTRVILTLLFLAVVTPTGVFAKLASHRFLDTEFRRNMRESYWIPKKTENKTKDHYERQF